MPRLTRFFALALSLAALAACRAPETRTAEVDGVRTVEGTLKYEPLPKSRSVRAYMGVEFTIGDGADRVVLKSSDKVSREALIAAAGSKVRVTCRTQAPTQPEPGSAYPMGPDGQPLQRPETCRVLTLSK
jgi:hypothetical protein